MASTSARRDGREGRGAWWNRLVYVTTATSLYPLRVPPNTLAPTPAASLATAASLDVQKLTPPTALYGHNVLLREACAYVSPADGCKHGDVNTRLYDVTPRAGAASVLDDVARAAWIASATVEPAVAMIFGEALACVHGAAGQDLAAPLWRCPEVLRPRDAAMAEACRTDTDALLRRVEAALAANVESVVVNGPLSCAADYECLVRVAQRLAESCGALAPLDVSERLQALAEANGALLRGVSGRRGAAHEDELAALHEAHANAIRAFGLRRIEVARADGPGRRLEQEAAPAALPPPPPLDEDEWRLRHATNATCRAMAALGATQDRTNATALVAAHAVATRAWLRIGAAGNGPRGSGRVCVDCHYPTETVACRVHFAIVGQRLQQAHRDRRRAEADHSAARIQAVHDHVRRKLAEACCIRPHDAHGQFTGPKQCGAQYCKHVAANQRHARVSRAMRQLHREQPAVAAEAGVDLRVGLDLLDPATHVDPVCRNRSRHDAECIGRSIVAHIATKHGVSPDAIRRRVESVGGSLGDGVRGAARAMGMLREVRRAGSGADAVDGRHSRSRRRRLRRQRQRAEDARTAQALLERSRGGEGGGADGGAGRRLSAATAAARRAGVGTQPHPEGEAHGVEAHADDASAIAKRSRNASRGVLAGLQAIDAAAMRATTRHMAEQVGPQWHPSAGASMTWDVVKQAWGSPSAHLALVQAEHGSLTTRLGGALQAAATVRERVGAVWSAHQRRLAEGRKREHGRKLAANRAQGLFDKLEAEQAERLRVRVRRLADGNATPATPVTPPTLLSLPSEHLFSWVHDLGIDWRGLFAEGGRVARVLREREARRARGHVDHADNARRHPTGYWLLDHPDNAQPSAVGDALRRLSWRERHGGEDPPWHEPRADVRIRRRLYHGGAEGHVPKAVAAQTAADPPLARRLSEAFVEGTLAAPFAFFDTELPGGQVAPRSKESFWVATARYLVAGTAGCYFTRPEKSPSEAFGNFDDGETVYVHRPTANKMCFPAIYFVLPRIGEWRVITNTIGVNYYELTYERWCARDGLMQQTARAIDDLGLGENLTARNRNVLFPNAPLLRAAEGLDALTYAFYSSEQNTPHEAAGYLLCAMVQMGGLIYTVIVVGLALLMLSFFTVFNWLFGVFYDTGRAVTATGRNTVTTARFVNKEAGRRLNKTSLTRKGRNRRAATKSRKRNIARGLDQFGFDKDGNDGLSRYQRLVTDRYERRYQRYEAGKDRGLLGQIGNLAGGGGANARSARKRAEVFSSEVGKAGLSKAGQLFRKSDESGPSFADAGRKLREGLYEDVRTERDGWKQTPDGYVPKRQLGAERLARGTFNPANQFRNARDTYRGERLDRQRKAERAEQAQQTALPALPALPQRLPPQAMAVLLRRRAAATTGSWLRSAREALLDAHSVITGTPRRARLHDEAYALTSTDSDDEHAHVHEHEHEHEHEHAAHEPLTPTDVRALEMMIEMVEDGAFDCTDHEEVEEVAEFVTELLGG